MSDRETLAPDVVTFLAEWLLNGEVGASAGALAAVTLGATPTSNVAAPWDESDCGRCERLARRCPEVVIALPALIAANKRWKRWEKRIRKAADKGAWEP